MTQSKTISNLDIYTDGGSRGNPGPAAIGVYAVDRNDSNVIFKLSECIGSTTNNVAEWQGALKALNYLIGINLKIDQVNFYLDSELVVKQINGEYKIKQPHLQALSLEFNKLISQLKTYNISFNYIPREQNKKADSLVNQALDSN